MLVSEAVRICVYRELYNKNTFSKEHILSIGARIVCDAMLCARAGCILAVHCAARDAMQCAARRLIVVEGAGGAMLLTMVFLKTKGFTEPKGSRWAFFWDRLNAHQFSYVRIAG